MGEAKRRRIVNANEPGWGVNGLTVVGAVYKGATFGARIQPEDVPRILREFTWPATRPRVRPASTPRTISSQA